MRTTPVTPKPHPIARRGLTAFGQIDLCRGLFSILVVLCHGFTAAWSMDRGASNTISTAAHDWLLDSVGAGFYWVMGFFVLSGYCIHQSVDRQIADGRFDLRRYLIARATRILPLYYLALAFAIGAEAIGSTIRVGASDALDDRAVLLAQAFVVQNLGRCYPGFVASWSITNESIYYLLYGLLAAWAAGQRAIPVRVGLATCLLVGATLQIVYLAGYQAAWVIRVGLLFGLGINWFLGVLVAVERDRIRRSAWVQGFARLWPVVLGSAVVGYHFGLPIQGAYMVSGVAFTGLMIRMTASGRSEVAVEEPGWATAAVGFLGLMSYPTYLFHAPWQSLATVLLPWMGWDADWRITWMVLTASSLALGAAIGWCVERPIMRWRGDLLARLRARRPAPRSEPPVDPLALTHLQRTTAR